MAKDIFRAINIPMVGIIWTYNGLPAQEMAERITTLCERAATTNVDNIDTRAVSPAQRKNGPFE
jgi:multidrug efflux pump subunit AcrB